MKTKIIPLLLVLVLIFCLGCRTEEEAQPSFPEGTRQSENLWIKQQMERYYYWSTQLPKNPDYSMAPQDFLKSLLSSEDRYTAMVNPQDASTYPRSVRGLYGFDYTLSKAGGGTLPLITLVMQDSPASRTGLARGMFITAINGTPLSSANAAATAADMKNSTMLSLSVAEWRDGKLSAPKDVTIYYGYTFSQPLRPQIFEQDGRKVAYLYIYDFREGMGSTLLQTFTEIKSRGVSDLILDLRDNPGGSVAMAAALCAMIPEGIAASAPFIKYAGNKNGGTVAKTFAEQIAYDPSAPPFEAFRSSSLGLSRLYVLATARTASASEIVINNLRPYMQVVQVGDKTQGKDMAGFPVTDDRNPRQVPWELHPMIYKVYNARGAGNYPNGLVPDISVAEDAELPMLPLGNPQETLLRSALRHAGYQQEKSTP